MWRSERLDLKDEGRCGPDCRGLSLLQWITGNRGSFQNKKWAETTTVTYSLLSEWMNEWVSEENTTVAGGESPLQQAPQPCCICLGNQCELLCKFKPQVKSYLFYFLQMKNKASSDLHARGMRSPKSLSWYSLYPSLLFAVSCRWRWSSESKTVLTAAQVQASLISKGGVCPHSAPWLPQFSGLWYSPPSGPHPGIPLRTAVLGAPTESLRPPPVCLHVLPSLNTHHTGSGATFLFQPWDTEDNSFPGNVVTLSIARGPTASECKGSKDTFFSKDEVTLPLQHRDPDPLLGTQHPHPFSGVKEAPFSASKRTYSTKKNQGNAKISFWEQKQKKKGEGRNIEDLPLCLYCNIFHPIL